MSKNTLAAGTSPFAHLLAGAAALGSRALGRRGTAEDEKPDEEAEDDDDKPDAENDKPEEQAEDDKPDAEEEDDDKPAARRARRAKKAEEDDDEAEAKAESDDDDEEMAQARREGFLAAQARGRRIFGAAAAGVRPDMAAHFAFNKSMPSAEAIADLDMAAGGPAPSAPQGSRLGRRMARVVIPNPGASAGGKKPDELSFGDMAKAAAQKAGII